MPSDLRRDRPVFQTSNGGWLPVLHKRERRGGGSARARARALALPQVSLAVAFANWPIGWLDHWTSAGFQCLDFSGLPCLEIETVRKWSLGLAHGSRPRIKHLNVAT